MKCVGLAWRTREGCLTCMNWKQAACSFMNQCAHTPTVCKTMLFLRLAAMSSFHSGHVWWRKCSSLRFQNCTWWRVLIYASSRLTKKREIRKLQSARFCGTTRSLYSYACCTPSMLYCLPACWSLVQNRVVAWCCDVLCGWGGTSYFSLFFVSPEASYPSRSTLSPLHYHRSQIHRTVGSHCLSPLVYGGNLRRLYICFLLVDFLKPHCPQSCARFSPQHGRPGWAARIGGSNHHQ